MLLHVMKKGKKKAPTPSSSSEEEEEESDDDEDNRPLSAFRTRGVPGPTSKLSLRAPAQMGRRETEREGGREAGGRQA
jgi:hypothetical protein